MLKKTGGLHGQFSLMLEYWFPVDYAKNLITFLIKEK